MADDRVGVDALVGSGLFLAVKKADGDDWTVLSGVASGLATAGIEDSASSRQVPGQSKTVTRQSTGRHDWSGSLEIDRNVASIPFFSSLEPAETLSYLIGFRGAGTAKAKSEKAFMFKARTSKSLTVSSEDVQTFSITPNVDGDMTEVNLYLDGDNKPQTDGT